MHRLIELYKPLIGSREQKLIELKKLLLLIKKYFVLKKNLLMRDGYVYEISL